ncbi:MAG TPA: V4R domain-containing protein [Anaerolineales bacterium]|nr:V4R domain-containing protein [Anaerolineales bacterium]
MDPIPPSGYYYPNRFALITIDGIKSVMGQNGLNAILNLAHLSDLIDNYPSGNLEKDFDFSKYSSINLALEEMYGPRGGRGFALRAGRALWADALKNFGALAGVGDLAFKVLPLPAKLRIGLPAMAKIFSQISDQHTTVKEGANEIIYTIHRCPVCWGRSGEDKPLCFIAVGLLEESLKWVSGGSEFRVNESKCIAVGDEVCEFIIQKNPKVV